MIKKIFKLFKAKIFIRGMLHGIAATIELEDLVKDIKPPNTIIDVGSNKGQFLILIEKIFPNKSIHSFEPIKEMLEKQKKFFNFKKDIFFNNFALGASVSLKEFYITNRTDSSSFLKIVEKENKSENYIVKAKREMHIQTLDNYFNNKTILQPLLIKMDVQGYELEVLKGSVKILKKTDYLLLEVSENEMYQTQPTESEIIEFLKKFNFRILKASDWHTIKDTNFKQRDILFKRNNE